MATPPVVSFQFPASGFPDNPHVQTNFDDLIKYISDRNDGSVSWDALSVIGGSTFHGLGTMGVALISGFTATATTGGSLAGGTYYYKVYAVFDTLVSGQSLERTVIIGGANNATSLTWTAVSGATAYRVSRGTASGAQSGYYTVTTNGYTDTGASFTAAGNAFSVTNSTWLKVGGLILTPASSGGIYFYDYVTQTTEGNISVTSAGELQYQPGVNGANAGVHYFQDNTQAGLVQFNRNGTSSEIVSWNGASLSNCILTYGTNFTLAPNNSGTWVINSSSILTPAGTAANPIIDLASEHTGIYRQSAGVLGITLSGTAKYNFLSGSIRPANDASQDLGSTSSRFQNFIGKALVISDAAGTPKTVTFQTPATLTDTYALTFPTTAGSVNQYLTTDGAGVLTWSNAAGTGTVNSGTSGRLAYYATTTNAVSEFTLGTAYQLVGVNSGATANAYLTLAGTSNQITVGTSGTTITLSTPQNLHSAATPTFASETLTATSNQLILGTTRTVTVTAPTPASTSRTVTIPDLTADYSVVGTEGTQTVNGNKTLSGTIDVSGLFKGKGTTTNDDAATGYIGEYLVQSRLVSAAQSMSNATAANITATKLTLGAGDWDITYSVEFSGTGATSTTLDVACSQTSATFPATSTLSVPSATGEFWKQMQNNLGNNGFTVGASEIRASLSGSTDFYLVAKVAFSAGSVDAWGYIAARRRR